MSLLFAHAGVSPPPWQLSHVTSGFAPEYVFAATSDQFALIASVSYVAIPWQLLQIPVAARATGVAVVPFVSRLTVPLMCADTVAALWQTAQRADPPAPRRVEVRRVRARRQRSPSSRCGTPAQFVIAVPHV